VTSIYELTLMKEKVNDETRFILLLFTFITPRLCDDNTMNKPSTDLYGTESYGKPAFATAPVIISKSSVTISAGENRTWSEINFCIDIDERISLMMKFTSLYF
jgi:hypothetical protein